MSASLQEELEVPPSQRPLMHHGEGGQGLERRGREPRHVTGERSPRHLPRPALCTLALALALALALCTFCTVCTLRIVALTTPLTAPFTPPLVPAPPLAPPLATPLASAHRAPLRPSHRTLPLTLARPRPPQPHGAGGQRVVAQVIDGEDSEVGVDEALDRLLALYVAARVAVLIRRAPSGEARTEARRVAVRRAQRSCRFHKVDAAQGHEGRLGELGHVRRLGHGMEQAAVPRLASCLLRLLRRPHLVHVVTGWVHSGCRPFRPSGCWASPPRRGRAAPPRAAHGAAPPAREPPPPPSAPRGPPPAAHSAAPRAPIWLQACATNVWLQACSTRCSASSSSLDALAICTSKTWSCTPSTATRYCSIHPRIRRRSTASASVISGSEISISGSEISRRLISGGEIEIAAARPLRFVRKSRSVRPRSSSSARRA
eukprot:scaffold119120_cov63-Phaeocystis_antarctica.AAC.3